MKINEDVEIVLTIIPRIYFHRPANKFIELQSQMVLETECNKLQPLFENILKRRLEERTPKQK